MSSPTLLFLLTSPSATLSSVVSLLPSLLSSPSSPIIHILLPPSHLPHFPHPPHPNLHLHILPHPPCPIFSKLPTPSCPILSKLPAPTCPLLSKLPSSPGPILSKLQSPPSFRAQLPSLIHYIQPLILRLRPHLILHSGSLFPLLLSFAQHLSIPLILLQPLPTTPTDLHPYPLSSIRVAKLAAKLLSTQFFTTNSSPRSSYLASYFSHLVSLYSSGLDRLNAFRKSLHLGPVTTVQLLEALSGANSNLHVFNIYSPTLLPAPDSIALNIHSFPPLRPSTSHSRPSFLRDYFRYGGRPLCVRTAGIRDVTATIDAVRNAGIRRLVVLAEEGQEIAGSKDVMVCTEQVDQAWVYGRCLAVICEGLQHVILDVLGANVPVMIMETDVESAFWGGIVEERGIGVSVRQDDVENGIKRALAAAKRQRVKEVGMQIRKEGHGADIVGRAVLEMAVQCRRDTEDVPWF